MIIDTHAHYDEDRFAEDLPEILAGFPAAGVRWAVNVGASWQGCLDSVRLAHEYDCLWAAVGLHPDDIADLTEDHIAWMREAANDPKVVAIGEIGLDYHWMVRPKEEQAAGFIRQMDLARELGLPINVHCRDAAEDLLTLVTEHGQGLGGIIHCFAGGADHAKKYVSMGYHLGIGGVVTFKNGRRLKEVVAAMPLSALVLETDSPYLAPEPHRGIRNDSRNLPLVAAAIAEIKGISVEEVVEATYQNALTAYPKLSIG